MLNVLHIYIIASEASEFFSKKCTPNMQKMFTTWSVISDSADFFGGRLETLGEFPAKVPG